MSRALAVLVGIFLGGAIWLGAAGGTMELAEYIGWLKLRFADEQLGPAATMWLGTPVGALVGGALGYWVSAPEAPPWRGVKALLVMIALPAFAMLITLHHCGNLGRS